MKSTYKAVEVSAPGVLRVVERPVSEPAEGQVRIRVEACGICHTDAGTVTGTYPGLKLPRVPGHEVVGRIEALGNGVSKWKIGQRVGVGLIAGEDGVCEPCRRGDIVNCQNPVTLGIAHSWLALERASRIAYFALLRIADGQETSPELRFKLENQTTELNALQGE